MGYVGKVEVSKSVTLVQERKNTLGAQPDDWT